MASRRPLVNVNGDIQELPSGDTLAGAVAGGSQEVYVQQTRPTNPGPWMWWKTDANGNIINLVVNDGNG